MNRYNLLIARRTISGLGVVFAVWMAGARALPTAELPEPDVELPTINLGGESLRSPVASRPPFGQSSIVSPFGRNRDDVERHGNPLWTIPLSTLSATRERPIFTPSRRAPARFVVEPPPPEPLKAPPPPPAPETPRLALVGSVANDQQGIAIFVDKATGQVIRLKVGDAHVGWVLRLVEGRQTTLEKDHRTVVVKLPSPGETPPNPPMQPASLGSAAGVLPGLQDVKSRSRAQLPPPTVSLVPAFEPGQVPSASGRVPGL